MSKLYSRFSHLRINTGTEEYRNSNNSKNKQKPPSEINTFRIQSPKNIELLFSKNTKISLTSPLTAKNDNNKNRQFLGNISNIDSVNKAIKPSILSVFKNNIKNKMPDYQNNTNYNLTNIYKQSNNTENGYINKNDINNNLSNTNNALKSQYKDVERINSDNNINKKINQNNIFNYNRENYKNEIKTNISNTERNYKSESPSLRKDTFNNRKNIETENNYENKVIHTENLHEKTRKPQFIDIMNLISSNQVPISLNILTKSFTNFDKSKHSTKSMKYVKGYSANTHQGTVRNYNEDRVSIILNVIKPNSFTGDYWPKCSIFGIYDGHGGSVCADFLRDHLHQYVIRNPNFPNNPREAILRGFENAEKDFINNYALDKSGEIIDRSGSCAIMIFVIANVGDSRAVLSKNKGNIIDVLTTDHKPNQKDEEKRIILGGGKIYQ